MTAFSPQDMRAIRVYCEQSNAVPQLSIYPMVRVKSRLTGRHTDRHIDEIVTEYKQYMREASREAAKTRRTKQGSK